MNFSGPTRRGGVPQKYVLTPEIRERILRDYKSDGATGIADDLGVPKWRVQRWAAEIGLSRTKEPFWSEDEIEYLREHYGRMSNLKIAKHLGRTKAAVHLKAKRLSIRGWAKDASCSRDLAILLGVDDHRVLRWIERGWLDASQDCPGGVWRFSDKALRAFLRDHGYALDLSRVEAGWLMELAFGKSEWRGDIRTCRHCSSTFFSRLETKVERVCAPCASRGARRVAA